MFGHHIKGPEKHRIPERRSVSEVSGICGPVKTSSKQLQFCFIFLFPELSRN